MKKKSSSKTIIAVLFTVLFLTVHSGAEAVDNIPPEVGDISCGETYSTAKIAVTDNEAFDCANSSVVVKNGNTGDIISPHDYFKSCTGDGTTSGFIDITVKDPSIPYIFEVNARDVNGNESGIQERSTSFPCREPPHCVIVDPQGGIPGETLDITITGEGTSFTSESVVTFSCPGATAVVKSATATTLVATVTITQDAAPCTSDVTVKTGAEQVTCPGVFELCCPPPACTSVVPSLIFPGNTTDITITGKNFTGLTKADITFEGCAITINSATVNSDTELTANITAGTVAQNQTCTATLRLAGTTTDCTIIVEGPTCSLTVDNTILPLKSSWLFPQIRRFVISIPGCFGDRTCAISIEDIKVIIPLIKDSCKITGIIVIPPKISGFKGGEKQICIVCGADECCGTIIIN